jgi:hypothetical protein
LDVVEVIYSIGWQKSAGIAPGSTYRKALFQQKVPK